MEVLAEKKNDLSKYQIAGTLDGVGLSPLLLATLGFLTVAWVFYFKSRLSTYSTCFRCKGLPQCRLNTKFFVVLHLPILTGLVFILVGAKKLFKPDGSDTSKYKTLASVGIALLMLSFLVLVLLTVLTFSRINLHLSPPEKMFLLAIVFSIPFLCVRLVYSAIFFFTQNVKFSPIGGDIVIQACLQIPEEMITILTYLLESRSRIPRLSAPEAPHSNERGSHSGDRKSIRSNGKVLN
jgi:low temperature requirement protein LtrA